MEEAQIFMGDLVDKLFLGITGVVLLIWALITIFCKPTKSKLDKDVKP